uniref:SET domain-containing protein n=1 Tax=Caenorhabditis tropicalis TaxID=1561998 RepID=A0A1I7UVX8_9PELO
MYCNEKLAEFALSKVEADYFSNVEEQLQKLDENCTNSSFIINVVDPLSIAAETTLFGGTVKFVNSDTVGSKIVYLKHIRDNRQHFLLSSLRFPSSETIDIDHNIYKSQLDYRMQMFEEYPFVNIFYPEEDRGIFYSPPPLTSIMCQPISEEMINNWFDYPYFFPENSRDTSFNGAVILLHSDFIEDNINKQPIYLKQYTETTHLFMGMKRHAFTYNNRFGKSFDLYQEDGLGWRLSASEDIEANVPLMVMCGVIRPFTAALSCLKTYGEQAAFSSFIEIPGTGRCLDRSEFYDFSKYIQHSCNPTCGVRLAESGNEFPDLVIYSLVPINDENSREISIDYFKGFKDYIDKYFSKTNVVKGERKFSLYNDGIDFVLCQCGGGECREVLYIDRSTERKIFSLEKQKKLSHIHPSFKFGGMELAESNKVWKIEFMKFIDN